MVAFVSCCIVSSMFAASRYTDMYPSEKGVNNINWMANLLSVGKTKKHLV